MNSIPRLHLGELLVQDGMGPLIWTFNVVSRTVQSLSAWERIDSQPFSEKCPLKWAMTGELQLVIMLLLVQFSSVARGFSNTPINKAKE